MELCAQAADAALGMQGSGGCMNVCRTMCRRGLAPPARSRSPRAPPVFTTSGGGPANVRDGDGDGGGMDGRTDGWGHRNRVTATSARLSLGSGHV